MSSTHQEITNLCILWELFAEFYRFNHCAKVMALSCNQLSLNGLVRKLFPMSLWKGSALVAVTVSLPSVVLSMSFSQETKVAFTWFLICIWIGFLTMYLPRAEQQPWQCMTVGSWCLCWPRLEQLSLQRPLQLPLRLCRHVLQRHPARWVAICKCRTEY